MHRSAEIEIKVGLFVALGLALIMLTIIILGGGQSFFQRNTTYHTQFNEIEGLVEGAIVKISGIRVGQVTKVKFTPNGGKVDVTFNVAKKYANAVRQDSLVGIQTQGVLGDRFLIVSHGSASAAAMEDGSELKSEPPKELKDYLNSADAILDHLKNSLTHIESILGSFSRDHRSEIFFKNVTAMSSSFNDSTKNLKTSLDHLQSIFSKIDHGSGTVGALINDPSLYDDLKSLLGGANRNRVLKYFIKKSVEESRENRDSDKDANKKK